MSIGEIRVVPLAGREAEWDRFVKSASGSTFCHQGGWTRILTDVMKAECEYLVAEDATGSWRGVLPLVHVRGLAGHYLVSMPFVDDGGPLGDESARVQLATSALEIARAKGAKLLELRSRVEIGDPLRTSTRKVSVQLELPGTIDELWSKTFKAKLRSQVKRPAKEGMYARTGPSERDAFYAVFSRNMRDLGTPVLPRRFFEMQTELFGETSMFTAVYSKEGVPAAGSCCFIWRGEAYVTWASSLREFNKLSPNMLLYGSMMERAIERGVTRFNFGRSTPDAPTHKFKQQWGGVDVPLPWATWSGNGDSATPTPDKPIFRIATSVWRRIPVPVANRIGPMLARQLP